MIISEKEAIETIKEWGVDCDNFVAYNCKQFMSGGEPDDNSIELGQYFQKCLEIVCKIAISNDLHQHIEALEAERDELKGIVQELLDRGEILHCYGELHLRIRFERFAGINIVKKLRKALEDS